MNELATVLFFAAFVVGVVGAWIEKSLACASIGLVALAFFVLRWGG